MTPKQWKRLFARILLWAGIVIACMLLFFLVRSTWHIYTKEREVARSHRDEAQAFAELTARQASLAEELQRLDTSRGLEAEVRERYPVAKSGEQVIVITDNPNGSDATSTPPQSGWDAFVSWFSWF